MNIKGLIDKFRDIAAADTAIGTFAFDDLPSVNTNRQKSYPLILFKTPQSVMTPFLKGTNEPIYENFTIIFYCLKTWNTEDKATVTLEQRYQECETIASNYLRNILTDTDNVYSLYGDKAVSKSRGHHQHVDQLVGVSYTFNLRVFNPICT